MRGADWTQSHLPTIEGGIPGLAAHNPRRFELDHAGPKPLSVIIACDEDHRLRNIPAAQGVYSQIEVRERGLTQVRYPANCRPKPDIAKSETRSGPVAVDCRVCLQ
jgi:hypothetical protein